MRAVSRDTIFTNVGLAPDGTPWWEGIDAPRREGTLDWHGVPSSADRKEPLAHPNARYTTAASQCPSVGEGIDAACGVPISGIIFGGRRARLAPLVFEATSFAHGVYLGATLVSETTAAATGAIGVARHDPMAMLPFCGYHMADYFRHWLDVGKRLDAPPKVFHVNWFRTDADGDLLWPGYGENIRVLSWMIRRIHGATDARATAIGYVPLPGQIDLGGLGMSDDAYDDLFEIDDEAWAREADEHRQYLAKFGARLPAALAREQAALARRIAADRPSHLPGDHARVRPAATS
jgi:phosphoenolpyruvate carboxykinase (GTP)